MVLEKVATGSEVREEIQKRFRAMTMSQSHLFCESYDGIFSPVSLFPSEKWVPVHRTFSLHVHVPMEFGRCCDSTEVLEQDF